MPNKLISGEGLRIIRFYIEKYQRDFTTLGILSVISAITNASVPFFVGRLIDAVANPKSALFKGTFFAMPYVLAFIAVWFIAKIIADIVDRKIYFHSDRLENFIEGDYIVRGAAKILEFPLSFHKSQKMGEVINRINRAAGLLSQIISHILIDLAPQFLSIIAALVITFMIQPILALILVFAVSLYALILIRVTPGLAGLHRKMHTTYSRAYGDIYDTVSNIQTVKQAVAEKYEKQKHQRNFNRAIFSWFKLASIWQALGFYQRLLVSLTQLAIFALSILFIQKETMTIGELIMFNGYAAMLFGPFAILGRNWQAVQNGLAAISRAENILKTKPEVYEPKNAAKMPEIKGGVEFVGVSFKYQRGAAYILRDINFKVAPGKTVALVGESGVGKTTLIDLISLYFKPSNGKILIDGLDIGRLDLKTLRSRIGIVPQEISLFNDTIENNIRYGKFNSSDEEVAETARLAHADGFIESFPKKYKQVVGERGIKLSTGQKQRVAIARAILRDPRILILDEPTSALDAKSEKFISESLEKLMRGRTTFIIAHRLSTVRRADAILVLKNGRIVESGTHDELIKIPSGSYRRLYELQIGLK